jgi:hypothetical protein
MSREYTLKIHAVNISADPHPQGTYRELFKRLYRLKRPIQVRGDRHALMTFLQPAMRGGQHVGYYGTLSTFTEINPDQPWLNTETGMAAEDDETLEISIPESLRPNLAQFEFYLDFDNHVFAFQGSTRLILKSGTYKSAGLSPLQVETYLNRLFAYDEVRGNLDSLVATIIPDPDALKRILNSENIREISISVSIPNSDNIAEERGRVAERLRQTRSRRKVEIYSALDKSGIQPDQDMKTAAKVASYDGRVDARVKVNGHTQVLSTTDRPFTEFVNISHDVHSESQVVRGYAATIAQTVKSE